MAKQPAVPQDLEVPKIKDGIYKREAKQGPRVGDWVIMPDGSWQRLTSRLSEHSSWVGKNGRWPLDGVADPKNPNRVNHPCFGTDWVHDSLGPGSFALYKDGTVGHSGGNNFHNVSRRTKLLDTGQTKPGKFWAFKGSLSDAVDFELPCRVYRVVESDQ